MFCVRDSAVTEIPCDTPYYLEMVYSHYKFHIKS